MRRRRPLERRRHSSAAWACALALWLVAVSCTPAAAATTYVDGISDQNIAAWSDTPAGKRFASFFASSWVTGGHIRLARYVVQWNAMSDRTRTGRSYRERFEAWLKDVASLHLIADVALTSYTGAYPSSAADYEAQLRGILDRSSALGHPVRYLEPWNEPNNQGHVSAIDGALYTNAASSVCAARASCTVVAGNFEDAPELGGYEDEYVAHLDPAPTIWGLHPYRSVEHRSAAPALTFLAHLPHGGAGEQIWLTEVGARSCTDHDGHLVMLGERDQADKASWLVNRLMRLLHPEHVFYYELLARAGGQAGCSSLHPEDDALYDSGEDPDGAPIPRPAAAYVFGGESFPWGAVALQLSAALAGLL